MRFLLLLSLAALLASPSTSGAQKAADLAAIRGLDSIWARMYAVHDTVAAARLYDDDLVFTSANGTQKGKAQEMADVRPSAGLTMEYFRTTPREVRAHEGTGVVTGVAEWAFAMNGARREVRRVYTAVYARGGPLGWRIVAIHMGNAPAP